MKKQSLLTVKSVKPKQQSPENIEKLTSEYSIQYGGIWSELYEKLNNLQSKEMDYSFQTKALKEEIELLKFENLDLQSKFKDTLTSLTDTSSKHLESQEIVRQIKEEKERLQTKVLALESHEEWVREQNKNLQNNILHQKEKCKQLEEEKLQLNEDIKAKDKLIDNYQIEIAKYKENNEIQSLQEQALREELKILKHSLSAKTNYIISLNKEKKTLEDALAEVKQKKSRLAGVPQQDSKVKKPSLPSANSKPEDTLPSTPKQSEENSTAAIIIESNSSPSGVFEGIQALEKLTPAKYSSSSNLVSKVNPWSKELPTPPSYTPDMYRKAATPTRYRIRTKDNPSSPNNEHLASFSHKATTPTKGLTKQFSSIK